MWIWKKTKLGEAEPRMGPNGLERKKGGNDAGKPCIDFEKGKCPRNKCSFKHAKGDRQPRRSERVVGGALSHPPREPARALTEPLLAPKRTVKNHGPRRAVRMFPERTSGSCCGVRLSCGSV